jgi:hypothetical protein
MELFMNGILRIKYQMNLSKNMSEDLLMLLEEK